MRDAQLLKKLENMTLEQKLCHVFTWDYYGTNDEQKAYIDDKLKRGCVGFLGVGFEPGFQDVIKRAKALAPNPILIGTDMETGYPPSKHKLPRVIALGYADDKKLAYQFGKTVAVEAKRGGHNTVWGPVVDYRDTDALCKIMRSMAGNPEKIAELAEHYCQALKDEGMFFTVKHYPGSSDNSFDNHMCPTSSGKTEEQLLKEDMIPYLHLMKKGLLPGIMASHMYFPKIDPDNYGTMSSKILGIIRKQGFDGLILSDSMAMQGIVAKYGKERSLLLALKAGIDLVMTPLHHEESYKLLEDAYNSGELTRERLDDAVYHVLAAQKWADREALHNELSDEDISEINRMYEDSVALVKDDDIDTKLDDNKKRLFVVLKPNYYEPFDNPYIEGEKMHVEVTFARNWHPKDIKEYIKAEFPNDEILEINEFPHRLNTIWLVDKACLVDEVIFMTYCVGESYGASDCLTIKMQNIIKSMHEKIGAVVHVGNPYAMEDIEHVKRIVFLTTDKSIPYALEILKGKKEAKGKVPFDIKLK